MSARGDEIRAVAARTWLALVHHPIYDRNRRIVTSAVTNLDIHDIARSSTTYGLAGYLLVTPVAAQQELARRILGYWEGEFSDAAANTRRGGPPDAHPGNRFRREALSHVEVVASVDDAIAAVTREAGAAPALVATTARATDGALAPGALVRGLASSRRPLLLLFGTGWGLADAVVDRVDHILSPVRGYTDYNHLSVRSAAAVVLDRLFGDHDAERAND